MNMNQPRHFLLLTAPVGMERIRAALRADHCWPDARSLKLRTPTSKGAARLIEWRYRQGKPGPAASERF